jgi:hypothetical protein
MESNMVRHLQNNGGRDKLIHFYKALQAGKMTHIFMGYFLVSALTQ